VWSTLLLADRLHRRPRISARSAFYGLTSEHRDLVARSIEHAASLHAAGPAILFALANQRGTYEALADLPTRDIAAATRRMELAGLIARAQPRSWRIVSPFVADALREERLPPPEPFR
jgi:hypothetical protein